MTDDDNGSGAGLTAEEDELFRRLTDMLRPQAEPPAMVKELARQSFALRRLDAELAGLTADSSVPGTAEAVRLGRSGPRLLTFTTPRLLLELEIGRSGAGHRIVGELQPAGPATIEIRQPHRPQGRTVDVDGEGRFLVDDVSSGPFSLTCTRPGQTPVATEWTRLD